IVWMAAILALSTDAGSAEHTGSFVLPALRFIWPTATLPLLESIHAVVRKLAHVTEYAVLGSLWYRAFAVGRRPPRIAVALAFGLSVAWAGVDEAFQMLVPSRTPSIPPHVGVGGWTPSPRNDNADSMTMTRAMSSVATTSHGVNAFGRMWRTRTRQSRTPSAWAAWMNSRSRIDRTAPRTTREEMTQP